MNNSTFSILLQGYLDQRLTAAELREFLDAAVLPEYAPLMEAAMGRDWQDITRHGSSTREQALASYEAVSKRISDGKTAAGNTSAGDTAAGKTEPTGRLAVMPVSRRWLPWVAAAAIIVMAGLSLWKMNGGKVKHAIPIASKPRLNAAPGKTGAILTLADGTAVVLDSLPDGDIAKQQGANISMHHGSLDYTASGTAGAIAYNTMSTPKGRQFHLTLPDGTGVWLNAASTIRYPTAFTGAQRQVAITGEAYFEVAPGPTPFLVNADHRAEIAVLGTHFNINSYANESTLNTTLLEGAIRVSAGGKQVVIRPGEQARAKDGIIVDKHADISRVMAWKNGLFNFEGASLEEVMRQLERWYDIEVIYETKVPPVKFGGEMTKGLSLNDVLDILKGMEESGLTFRLEEGRKLIVSQ